MTDAERDQLAHTIIGNLEVPFVVDNFEARISASIGVTVVPGRTFELGAVQRESDHALYVAKGQGRRRSVRFDERVRSELEERSEMETALRGAIEAEEVAAWGQPIVDLETNSIVAIELLARWRRTDGSYCPPSVFIPLAEEIGLIGDLGRQMLERAGEVLATWQGTDMEAVKASVNVSPRQLADESFVPYLASVVDRWEIPDGGLILELTETAELHELDDVEELLEAIVDLGVLLALDDFGSGYSSVQHVLGLPLEYVKLDGSLVRDLGHDPRQTALVRSVRDLAATLGRTVVVEGIENERQAARLAELRLRYVQGFLWGRARPLGELSGTRPSTTTAAARLLNIRADRPTLRS